jgi:hypothetical protein
MIKYAGLMIVFILMLIPAARAEDGTFVAVKNDKGHIVIDAVFAAQVPLEVAWDVMTDFDNMKTFLPYLDESAVVARSGGSLQVHQKGAVPVLFMNYKFDTTKNVFLIPFSAIRSEPADKGSVGTISVVHLTGGTGGTEIAYHADIISSSSLLSGFGSDTIRKITGEQFLAMKKEMRRRAGMKQYSAVRNSTLSRNEP